MFSCSYFFITLLVLLECFTLTSCGKPDNTKGLIQKAVREELRLHPKAGLTDIYKFFFQGKFGPGHIIKNKNSAFNYLKDEIRNSTEFDSVLFQPVGYNNRYHRINLLLVKDGIVPIDTFYEAFIQSTDSLQTPSIDEWRKEWDLIISVIEEMKLEFPNFEKDKQNLDKMLSSGKVAVHHTDIYRKLYHPHYRLVDKINFENLKITEE